MSSKVCSWHFSAVRGTASSRQLLEVERTCRRHRRTEAIDSEPTKTRFEISQRSEPLTDPHQSVILQYGALAARVEREAGQDRDRQIERIFEIALQRQPDPAEAEACKQLLAARSLAELCRAILNVNEFAYLD